MNTYNSCVKHCLMLTWENELHCKYTSWSCLKWYAGDHAGLTTRPINCWSELIDKPLRCWKKHKRAFRIKFITDFVWIKNFECLNMLYEPLDHRTLIAFHWPKNCFIKTQLRTGQMRISYKASVYIRLSHIVH